MLVGGAKAGIKAGQRGCLFFDLMLSLDLSRRFGDDPGPKLHISYCVNRSKLGDSMFYSAKIAQSQDSGGVSLAAKLD
jgi:hypothetical protein